MNLDKNQSACVKSWVADGASVADVQSRLKSEFGISMTYMDVRFLIDDLGAEIASKEQPAEADVPAEIPQESAGGMQPDPAESYGDDSGYGEPDYADADADDAEPAAEEGGYGSPAQPENPAQAANIQVSVSPIQRPDCIVSGDVVFSDGTKAEWRIDRMGQLGLIPEAGKTPPQSDMYPFQLKLQELLSKM